MYFRVNGLANQWSKNCFGINRFTVGEGHVLKSPVDDKVYHRIHPMIDGME